MKQRKRLNRANASESAIAHSDNASSDAETPSNPARRVFLQKTALAGGGLSLAILLPGCDDALNKASSPVANQGFEANAYVNLGTDNTVTVISTKLEMGQGSYTGLATLVAEELDADWAQVKVESAPVDQARYGWQGTGGSAAIAASYQALRTAGAAARAMLVAAAAQRWRVDAQTIQVKQGVVSHPKSGRKATFGDLAALAVQQTVPPEPPLKDPKNFSLIGKTLSRKDSGKTDGTALFTQDIQLPDMLTAAVLHPPRFGATLVSVDDSAARKLPGVAAVLSVGNTVAVLADTFWQAKQAREQVKVQWDESAAFRDSSDALFRQYRLLADVQGTVARAEGDLDAAFAKAHTKLEAYYDFPFLAHASMEPLNCVVQVNADGAEVWNGCQFQTNDQAAVAAELGLKPEQVKINTLLAGGSFGRRASANSDYVVEAARIAKAYGKPVPVKLVWTRENDTRAGYYRPMMVHKLKAGLDKQGKIIAWQHRIVGQSIAKGTAFEAMVQNGIDPMSVEGATNLPYDIANLSVELHTVDLPVPVLWWRSVGSTHTAFATEAFMDECAAKAGQDPLDFRLAHLKADLPRHRQALRLAAEKANWGKPLPAGHSRGLALHKSFGTTVAQVVEVSKQGQAPHKVENVTCAVDCGVAVNPDVIAAQMEGGIGFGLSPALMSEITFEKGKVVQSNFHDYSVIRMPQMPAVAVHIVPSNEHPTGVGEPAVPVIAPALANALFASGVGPLRRLPFGNEV